jgi:subtilase family serine protease
MALSRAPSVPSAFASSVHGLHGLHDFRKHAPKLTKSSRPRPMFDAGYDNADTLAFAPSDYATIYDITPLYTAGIDGTGQSIAIIGQSDVVDSDITGFRTLFSLPTTAPAVKKVLVPNSGTATVQQGDVDESELDLEWSGAVAKNAQIVFVFTGDSPLSNGVDDALAYAVDAQLAPVMSESYGGCDIEEPANANLDGEVIAAGNLLGITILASAGDSGAEGCFPQV